MLYAEHTIETENCMEVGYKGKREFFVMPNFHNRGYPGQIIKVSIPRKSSDTTMIRESQFLTFDVDLNSSKDRERSVVNNIGRALVAKKLYLLAQQSSRSLKTVISLIYTKTST